MNLSWTIVIINDFLYSEHHPNFTGNRKCYKNHPELNLEVVLVLAEQLLYKYFGQYKKTTPFLKNGFLTFFANLIHSIIQKNNLNWIWILCFNINFDWKQFIFPTSSNVGIIFGIRKVSSLWIFVHLKNFRGSQFFEYTIELFSLGHFYNGILLICSTNNSPDMTGEVFYFDTL